MKVDRLISIIMILLDKKRINAKDLADMFEVSPRTIYRDIDSIDLAGIPIRSIPGVGGGFEIMPNYKVDHKVFSDKDLSSILVGLSSLSDMTHDSELVHAISKVKSFIPTNKTEEIEFNINQIHIDLSPWMINQNVQQNLESIKQAIQNRNLISFDYIDRFGNKSIRIAEPYQLVLKSSHWYWQGYCLTRESFRLFRLSRMESLKVKNEIFTPRKFEKPQLEFSDILASRQSVIKIRIHKSLMNRVLDLCLFKNFIPDGLNHYIVDFPFIENDFYYNFILGLGIQCEILEPLYIRSEIKYRINKLVSIYNDQ